MSANPLRVHVLRLTVLVFVLGACGMTGPTTNLVRNGGFWQWSRGGNADPDDWARVAEIGRVERVEPTHRAEGYAAKYTRSDSNVNAYQDLSGFGSSQAVTCSAWIMADKKQVARLVLDDGATFSSSSWNETAAASESLSVSHTISPAATHLRLVLDVSGASPHVTVPGTTASFEDVRCQPAPPSVSGLVRSWDTSYHVLDRALELLIAVFVSLAALAWYQLRRDV
jgi:hypothetical protein